VRIYNFTLGRTQFALPR